MSDDNDIHADPTMREIERLRADPEVQRLMAALRQEQAPAEPDRRPAGASERRDHVMAEPPPRARQSVEQLARVIIGRPRPSLERIARETGISLDEFERLESGDPAARTQAALAVVRAIDAEWQALPTTLGGTATIAKPDGVTRSLGLTPRAGRNISGTLVRDDAPAGGTLPGLGHTAAEQTALATVSEDDDAGEPTSLPAASLPGEAVARRRGMRWRWAAGTALVAVAIAVAALARRDDGGAPGTAGAPRDDTPVTNHDQPDAPATDGRTPPPAPPAPSAAPSEAPSAAPPVAPDVAPALRPPQPSAAPAPAPPASAPAPVPTRTDPYGSLDE